MLSSQEIRTADHRARRGIGKEEQGPRQAALPQDRHHDRRRRRRLAHPHAAADVLLSPDRRDHREADYLYIAQPPLYQSRSGKKERYFKDDAALEDYLIELGNARTWELRSASAERRFAASAGELVQRVNRFERILTAVERKTPEPSHRRSGRLDRGIRARRHCAREPRSSTAVLGAVNRRLEADRRREAHANELRPRFRARWPLA